MSERDWLDPVVEGERAQQAAEDEIAWAEERDREDEEAYERKKQERLDQIDREHDAWLDHRLEEETAETQ